MHLLIESKDPEILVKSMESYFKKKPPDSSLFSQDNFEFPIHRELLYQTKSFYTSPEVSLASPHFWSFEPKIYLRGILGLWDIFFGLFWPPAFWHFFLNVFCYNIEFFISGLKQICVDLTQNKSRIFNFLCLRFSLVKTTTCHGLKPGQHPLAKLFFVDLILVLM